MTCKRFQSPVNFGEFFALYRSLWIICRTLDEGNYTHNLLLHKASVISDLCKEYQDWNESLDELYWCIAQISLNNFAVNPFNFEWKREAYKVHITNCFLLELDFV